MESPSVTSVAGVLVPEAAAVLALPEAAGAAELLWPVVREPQPAKAEAVRHTARKIDKSSFFILFSLSRYVPKNKT